MDENNNDTKKTSRWSLVDAIIVCCVLFLVGSLLMPAVAHVQENARRNTCTDRLRSLGIALNSYHETFQTFPFAAQWGADDLDLANLLSHKDPTRVDVTRDNWVQLLLPFMKQSDLQKSFDPSQAVVASANLKARTTELSFMHCPSDTYNRPDNQYELTLPDGSLAYFARGNFAINGGSEYVPVEFGTLANPGPTGNRYVYDEKARTFQWWSNGLAGINKCFSQKDIVNGQSTMVALEEIRAGLDPVDPRGVWALGQIGGSITWGHGVIGDDGGPNYTETDSGEDDILNGPALYEKLGAEFIDNEKMGACDYCNENMQATARSKHDGGVNVMMLDGAVRFVSDNVEGTLWHVMHSRETPDSVFDMAIFDEELEGDFQSGEAAQSSNATAANAETKAASKTVTNSIGMQFIRVPEGSFTMGLPNRGNKFPYPDDARPHEVQITRPFLLGIHEVTQKQYEAIMGSNPSWHTPAGKYKDRVKIDDTKDCPVDNASWDEAAEFCRRLSKLPEEKAAGRTYRLPTEAEWEWACRSGTQDAYDQSADWKAKENGGIIANKANAPAEQFSTSPVGSFPANNFGLHDMCGNVYEWVSDYRRTGYYNRSPLKDPQGPANGYLHVIRGWYWVATGPYCKVYVANDPWIGNPCIGFRVVCERYD